MASKNRRGFYVPENPPEKPSWIWIILCFICASFTGPVGPAIGIYLALKRFKRDNERRQFSRFRQLGNLIGDRNAVSLRELAAQMGLNLTDVTIALQEMIDKGYILGHAYIDHSKKILYLDADEAAAAAASVSEPEPESVRPASTEPVRAAKPEPAPERPKPRPIKPVADSEEFEAKLREIRQMNDDIDDEEVSRRIDRIGELTASIFRVVREKPERADEVRRFMNYYLPTTLKLLKSYSLMEKQSYQGENIQASRKKIEDVLDTLIHAFEQQQDRLFRSEALDVETDISVLETMMASDGLLQREGELHPRSSASGAGN